MRTGQIVDFYDDPTGMILKAKVAAADLPDFIKIAQHLDEATRNKLPDDVFALVMVDSDQTMRKYACQDKGNTALSVIYFMETHDRLPEEAQKVAAANLLTACSWYDLQPPPQLYKLAELSGSEIMPKSGPEKTSCFSSAKGKTKASAGLDGNPDQSTQNPGKEEPEKLGHVMPYVDVTGKSAPVRMVEPHYERFCMEKGAEAFFPIDSYGQVKEASAWFDNYHQSLHPADRHEYATKLAARANELDIKVSDLIKKYGSSTYAPSGEVNVAVHCRMQHWAEDAPERDMLQGLMGKYASVKPEVFCEALRQFDELTGLSREWDETIHDPWYSTYGFDKTAGEWVFSHAGERITSEQLRNFAKSERYCKIKHTFGDELADGLKKHPEKIFDSLPLDSKRIIMRLAADPQP